MTEPTPFEFGSKLRRQFAPANDAERSFAQYSVSVLIIDSRTFHFHVVGFILFSKKRNHVKPIVQSSIRGFTLPPSAIPNNIAHHRHQQAGEY